MQEGLEGNPVGNAMKKYSRVLAVLFVPLTMNFSKVIPLVRCYLIVKIFTYLIAEYYEDSVL